jgi:hypothetical protein
METSGDADQANTTVLVEVRNNRHPSYSASAGYRYRRRSGNVWHARTASYFLSRLRSRRQQTDRRWPNTSHLHLGPPTHSPATRPDEPRLGLNILASFFLPYLRLLRYLLLSTGARCTPPLAIIISSHYHLRNSEVGRASNDHQLF